MLCRCRRQAVVEAAAQEQPAEEASDGIQERCAVGRQPLAQQGRDGAGASAEDQWVEFTWHGRAREADQQPKQGAEG